tara:strand:+ start:4664 stop:6517 length:1854 start_codon:yes stop_codon:yes gene_type:complete
MENSVTSVIPMVRKFEDAEKASFDERARNERDRDYYDGKQLTDAELKTLRDRGQPPVKYNRIRRKVNFMLGLERQSRKDPKCFPRNPDDDDAAQAATDVLRYVCDKEDWDAKRSQAWEEILVDGTGAVMVGAKQDKHGITPSLINISWDRLFYDPHSRRHDFSDANYMGILTWYDFEDALAVYPEAEDILVDTLREAAESATYDDRPSWSRWADSNRKRVRITEMFYREDGQWMTCLYTEAGFLRDPEPSPYLDEEGQPENPICAMSMYVDRDNNRYGDVRDLIDPQDEINKRRSKGLHLITMRQARIDPASGVESDRVRKELAKPDGVIQAGQGELEILNTNDMAAQNLQLLQEAKAEIDLLGANASLQGKNENDMSGRAILAQQQGGMVEVALHMDRLRHLTLKVYEGIWNRTRQFWQAPRWVRVTDDEKTARFVGVNQPITAGDAMRENIENNPEAMAALQQNPEAVQRLQQFMASPMAQQQVGTRNVPTEIDIDIIVDEGMDTPTVQAEQWAELVKMLPAFGPLAQSPAVIKMIIQSSQLRDKDKLMELVDEMNAPNPEAQQAQQQMQELAMTGQQAEVEKTQSETAKNVATAEAATANIQIEAFKAGASVAA